ncbi:hypothetical protein Ciccas_008447 [Cichlidogyrus casuarinus]|uniref:Uncharacterized protein n=1 Tax=Cichlidogyrus casuarinus TaxID=1844966 RepID=A0ABD2Q169_9PLAT
MDIFSDYLAENLAETASLITRFPCHINHLFYLYCVFIEKIDDKSLSLLIKSQLFTRILHYSPHYSSCSQTKLYFCKLFKSVVSRASPSTQLLLVNQEIISALIMALQMPSYLNAILMSLETLKIFKDCSVQLHSLAAWQEIMLMPQLGSNNGFNIISSFASCGDPEVVHLVSSILDNTDEPIVEFPDSSEDESIRLAIESHPPRRRHQSSISWRATNAETTNNRLSSSTFNLSRKSVNFDLSLNSLAENVEAKTSSIQLSLRRQSLPLKGILRKSQSDSNWSIAQKSSSDLCLLDLTLSPHPSQDIIEPEKCGNVYSDPIHSAINLFLKFADEETFFLPSCSCGANLHIENDLTWTMRHRFEIVSKLQEAEWESCARCLILVLWILRRPFDPPILEPTIDRVLKLFKKHFVSGCQDLISDGHCELVSYLPKLFNLEDQCIANCLLNSPLLSLICIKTHQMMKPEASQLTCTSVTQIVNRAMEVTESSKLLNQYFFARFLKCYLDCAENFTPDNDFLSCVQLFVDSCLYCGEKDALCEWLATEMELLGRQPQIFTILQKLF